MRHTVWLLKKDFAIKVGPHRQLWDVDERRRRRRRWVSFLTTIKRCAPCRSRSPVFFPFPCVGPEWESVCRHEDQLEGIPISTAGFFPSVALFSAEGTVLFHLNECASSIFLRVCVCIYLGCTEAMTERTLNKCHPMYHTPQPYHFNFFRSLNTCACSDVCLCACMT